ncbi:AraC family transcriptional regulator [Spirosoma arcticum]
MTFQEFTPSPALRPFVDRFWIVETFGTDVHPMEHALTPNGMDGLIFLFQTDRPQIILRADRKLELPTSYGLVQPLEHWRLQIPTPCGIAGVFFKPGVLHRWLRYPMLELTKQPVDLEALWGRQVTQLTEQLSELPSQRVALLETFLTKRLPIFTQPLTTADHAIRLMAQQPASQSIQSLVTQLGVSRQFLARQFAQQVGISPKQFGRIARFNALHRFIAGHQQPNWLDMVYQFGYYDQSHLIKDFRQFMGWSPSDYLQASTQAADFYAGQP